MRRPVNTRENSPHALIPRTARVRADRLLSASIAGIVISQKGGNPAQKRRFEALALQARTALELDKDSRILIPGTDFALVSRMPVVGIKP